MSMKRKLSVQHGKHGWFVESNYDPGFGVTGYFYHRADAERELIRLRAI